MKNINEYINESLIAEANGQLVVFFNHENPETTYVVTGADNKLVKKISNFDFDVQTIPYTKNLIDITHSDEWGGITDLGIKNENQLKTKVLNSIKSCLDEVEKDFAYIKYDPIPVENEYEDYDNKEDYTKLSANDWYQMLVDMYNDSYIDRDSSSARVVYNPEKKEVIFGSGMNIMCYTAEEFEEVLKEWEDE